MEEILDELKIGDKLTVGVNAVAEEIGLFIASEDVSASCAFRKKEWGRFVEAINKADKKINS